MSIGENIVMGLEKVGASIGKEIIAWARTGKSFLATRPVKINTQGLKYLPTLERDTVQFSRTTGKHKIPRYLYHMTSLENYNKMLESGFIRPSGARLPDGVYMLELDSFSKYWNKGLRNDLCDLIFRSGESKNIVMLRIPTKNLEASQIKLRTQRQVEGKLSDEFENEWWGFTRMPAERKKFIDDLLQKYGKQEAIKRYLEIVPKKFDPITKGIEAKFTPLYKQKKSDIEFIYGDKIPMSDVELVGQFNYEKEVGKSYSLDLENRNLCKTIFEKIFNGKPEAPFLKGWRE